MIGAREADMDEWRHSKAIHNIVKVNHAGEYGAIRIYRGQILVSRWCHQDLVPTLREFMKHEEEHFRVFNEFVEARGVRRCRVFFLWGVGGWALGFLTGLLGRRAIMTCTAAVETTVDRHLAEQIAFLSARDRVLCKAIGGIRVEEQQHRDYGDSRSAGGSRLLRLLRGSIEGATESVIWLSMRF